MQERLDKAVIDQAFDNARIFLVGKQQRQNSTTQDVDMQDEHIKAFEQKAGARICFHLAKYFKAINSIEQAKQLFRKAIKMGERGEGEAMRLLDEITKQQKTKPSVAQPTNTEHMEVDTEVPNTKTTQLLDAQNGFKKCLQAITDKEWSRLFDVRQDL